MILYSVGRSLLLPQKRCLAPPCGVLPGNYIRLCLLRGDGTAPSSVSSSSGAAPTAAIANIAEARIEVYQS